MSVSKDASTQTRPKVPLKPRPSRLSHMSDVLPEPKQTKSAIPDEAKCDCSSKCLKSFFRNNLLTLLIFLGVVCGVALGVVLKRYAPKGYWTTRRASYIGFLGELFINMLKCMAIPLITTSIIAAIGTVDIRTGKFIAARGIGLYMFTTVVAVILGIVLVLLIRPGERGSKPVAICNRGAPDSPSSRGLDVHEWSKTYGAPITDTDPLNKWSTGRQTPSKCAKGLSGGCTLTIDTLLDLIRSLFPPNIFQATVELPQTRPDLKKPVNTNDPAYADCNAYNDDKKKKPLEEFQLAVIYSRGTNIMGLIIFSVAIAVAAVSAGPMGTSMMHFFVSLSDVILIVTTWIIWVSPVGIMSLVAAQIIQRENLLELFATLGFYSLTVMIGLFIHGFVTLPVLYIAMTRKLPFRFYMQMSQALTTAFGTSSSSATVPVTIHCLEKKVGIDSRIVRFLIPIGATINLDGTGLYEAVAAIYISQLHGIQLSLADTILISITATIASIGAAGIPSAGVVTMVIVLNTIGLPAEFVSYILPVDWILDRFRTALNVLGDSVVASIVHHTGQAKLKKLNELEEARKLRKSETLGADVESKVNSSRTFNERGEPIGPDRESSSVLKNKDGQLP